MTIVGRKTLVALDLGTANVRALVAEERNGRPDVRLVLKEPSSGMRRGAVQDLAECGTAVGKVLGAVRKVHRAAVKAVYVNVGTSMIKCQQGRGVVAVSRADSEIYEDDVDRVLKASQAVSLPPNRTIVHNVIREYIVDGVTDISDPLGLSGNRLEANTLILDAFAPHVKNIIRLAELAGGRIGGLVLDPIAASRSALSKQQKELGTVVVDIGGGTTGMAVYEENKLVHAAIFPVGGGSVTNDVAITLKIPITAAEQLKLHYGYAVAKDVGLKESIELSKFAAEASNVVPRRYVAEIIEARLAEVLEFVHNELKLVGRAGKLAGGAVLVGGGAKLPGLIELARQELKMTSTIGCAARDELGELSDEHTEAVEDPEFATAVGILLWGAEQEGWLARRPFGWGKKLVKYFWP